ncbi:MAG: helix-hairpin-helix domain-containing protein [Bacteroidales bacterium]|nr:helix-hairpin-helix domain-containing protein [Bacteroidales bacterium]
MGREIHRPERSSGRDSERTPSAIRIGTVAAVFLIIIYEVALFVREAAVSRIAANRDRPDTVYIYSPAPSPSSGLPISPAGSPGADVGLVRSAHPSQPAAGPLPLTAEGGHATRRLHPDAPSALGSDAVEMRRNAEHGEMAQRIYEAAKGRRVESFRFDPNTVSLSDLQRLGFSEKQAAAIENYRAKGGRFHRKEDFAKSFVVADSVYRRLEPYIDIPKLDINAADSAAFDALPGIGPYFAARMVALREKLHGYSYPEQLLQIPNFGAERYEGLKDLITVGP